MIIKDNEKGKQRTTTSQQKKQTSAQAPVLVVSVSFYRTGRSLRDAWSEGMHWPGQKGNQQNWTVVGIKASFHTLLCLARPLASPIWLKQTETTVRRIIPAQT